MIPNNFFRQLRDELHGYPLRDRFLEELEDHAEDLEQEKLKEDQWTERMGEPLLIKENFMKIMHPFGKLFFVLEGLFYGLIFVPIALVFFTALKNIFTSFSELMLDIPLLIFGILIFVALMTFGHVLSFKRLAGLENAFQYSYWWWKILTAVPSTLVLTLVTYLELNEKLLIPQGTVKIIYIIPIYILLFFCLAKLGSFLAKGKRLKKKVVNSVIILNFLKKAFIIYFSLGLIARCIALQIGPIDNGVGTGLFIIFGPVMGMEYFFTFLWGGLMGGNPNSANLFISFYLPLFLIFFLGLQSLWAVIKDKNWLSVRGLMVAYVLSLFFINSQFAIGLEKNDFKVPAVNVSQMIEKNMVGIFYPLLKYFNQDEGNLFRYTVGFQSKPGEPEGFLITSNVSKSTFIPYGGLNLNEPHLIYNNNKMDAAAYTNLPEGYDCDRSDLENCNLYNFVNENIVPIGVPVSSAAFSPDGKWGAIVLPTGAYDPENVYLVRLKN